MQSKTVAIISAGVSDSAFLSTSYRSASSSSATPRERVRSRSSREKGRSPLTASSTAETFNWVGGGEIDRPCGPDSGEAQTAFLLR